MNRMTDTTVTRRQPSVLSTNKVLRNTYMLLSMTLLFSAAMAGLAMMFHVPRGTAMIASFAAIGLVWFALPRTANSSTGILVVFAIAGLLGFSIGPMVNAYLSFPDGPRVVGTALGGTGLIFLGMSGYALTSKRDFSFMGGMLFTGLIIALIGSIASIFFHIPAFSLAISGMIALVMSGMILFDTSRIINGGETNYIHATVSLYLNIYNLFSALLHILMSFSGDD